VVWGITKFGHYLRGRRFNVRTDHPALLQLFKRGFLAKPTGPAGRLERWLLELQEYDMVVVHRPGHDNVVADAMSRHPAVDTEVLGVTVRRRAHQAVLPETLLPLNTRLPAPIPVELPSGQWPLFIFPNGSPAPPPMLEDNVADNETTHSRRPEMPMGYTLTRANEMQTRERNAMPSQEGERGAPTHRPNLKPFGRRGGRGTG